jgi:hypothetical protein
MPPLPVSRYSPFGEVFSHPHHLHPGRIGGLIKAPVAAPPVHGDVGRALRPHGKLQAGDSGREEGLDRRQEPPADPSPLLVGGYGDAAYPTDGAGDGKAQATDEARTEIGTDDRVVSEFPAHLVERLHQRRDIEVGVRPTFGKESGSRHGQYLAGVIRPQLPVKDLCHSDPLFAHQFEGRPVVTVHGAEYGFGHINPVGEE